VSIRKLSRAYYDAERTETDPAKILQKSTTAKKLGNEWQRNPEINQQFPLDHFSL